MEVTISGIWAVLEVVWEGFAPCIWGSALPLLKIFQKSNFKILQNKYQCDYTQTESSLVLLAIMLCN